MTAFAMGKIPDISDDLLTLIQHFLVRVNPDYRLPLEVDLIAEAQQIRKVLLEKQYRDPVFRWFVMALE